MIDAYFIFKTNFLVVVLLVACTCPHTSFEKTATKRDQSVRMPTREPRPSRPTAKSRDLTVKATTIAEILDRPRFGYFALQGVVVDVFPSSCDCGAGLRCKACPPPSVRVSEIGSDRTLTFITRISQQRTFQVGQQVKVIIMVNEGFPEYTGLNSSRLVRQMHPDESLQTATVVEPNIRETPTETLDHLKTAPNPGRYVLDAIVRDIGPCRGCSPVCIPCFELSDQDSTGASITVQALAPMQDTGDYRGWKRVEIEIKQGEIPKLLRVIASL